MMKIWFGSIIWVSTRKKKNRLKGNRSLAKAKPAMLENTSAQIIRSSISSSVLIYSAPKGSVRVTSV